MLRIFLEFALLIIVIAWVLAEALSALGRWSDKRADSRLARDMEMGGPAKDPHEPGGYFGTLPVFVMVLLFLLLVPNAVTSNGQSISLHEVSHSVQASDVGPVAAFVNAWRAESPLGFWGFFVGLPVTVIWLFRRSPVLFGVAVVAALLLFWLKTEAGISTLSF
jgi:hypothetical protein